jgi:hypothetical protein
MDWHVLRQFAQSAAASVALARLAYLHLTNQFRALAWYLGLILVSNLFFSALSQHSATYFWFYIVLIPLDAAAGIFAVRELIALIFTNYPGIRTVGRWALYAAIGLSAATSIVLTRLFSYSGLHPRQKWGVFYMETAQRSITFSLAIVIIAILFVLSKYPLKLGRNTYLCCAFFGAIFLAKAAQLLVDSSKRLLFSNLAETAAAVSISACLFAWGFLLRPETAPARRPAVPTAHEDRLLQQLESLNIIMARAARR